MAMYWPQGWKKKGYHQIWEANLQPQNAQSWAQVFLGPDSECKVGLSVAIFYAR
jgi:hypothetical protein